MSAISAVQERLVTLLPKFAVDSGIVDQAAAAGNTYPSAGLASAFGDIGSQLAAISVDLAPHKGHLPTAQRLASTASFISAQGGAMRVMSNLGSTFSYGWRGTFASSITDVQSAIDELARSSHHAA